MFLMSMFTEPPLQPPRSCLSEKPQAPPEMPMGHFIPQWLSFISAEQQGCSAEAQRPSPCKNSKGIQFPGPSRGGLEGKGAYLGFPVGSHSRGLLSVCG